MSFLRGTEEYYKKFIELQEKLRKSEEERLVLEMKFNEMVQFTREEEQTYYRKLRNQYKRFLEEDRRRQERNERIIRVLERIEGRAATLAAKTERFELLRQQYQAYLQRVFSNVKHSNESIQIPPEISTISEEKPDLYEHPLVRKAMYGSKFEDVKQPADLYEHPVIKKALSDNRKYKDNAKLDVVNQYLHSLSTPISGEEVLKTARSSNKISSIYSPEFTDSNGINSSEHEGSYYKNNAGSIADRIMTSINSKPKLSTIYHDKYGNNTVYDKKMKDEVPRSNFCGKISPKLAPEHNTEVVEVFNPQRLVSDSQNLDPKIEIESISKIDQRSKRNEVRFQDPSDEKDDRMPEIPQVSIIQDNEWNIHESKHSGVENLGNYSNIKAKNIVNENATKNQEEPIAIEASLIHENTEECSKDQDIIIDDISEVLDEGIEEKKYNEAMAEDSKEDTLHGENVTENDSFRYNEDEYYEHPVESNEHLEDDYSEHQQLYDADNRVVLDYPNQANDIQVNHDLETEENIDPESPHTQEIKPDSKPIKDIDDESQTLIAHNDENVSSTQLHESDNHNQLEQLKQDQIAPTTKQKTEQSRVQYDDNDGQSIVHESEVDHSIIQYEDGKTNVEYYQSNESDMQYDNVQPTIQHDQKGLPVDQYNENGQPLIQYDQNQQPIMQYDESGKIIMQYDENGQPIVPYDQNGQPIVQYDDNGQPLMQYDESGQPIMQYDETGQHMIQYDESGQPIIQYDETGQPIMQYDRNGQPFIQYDERGQPLVQYDERGQPLMQYDEHGQPLMQYDEHGQPIMQYDEHGQPITQFDENVEYVENGQPIMQYDENGQPILYNQNVNFDQNGQPIYQYEQSDKYYPENQNYSEQERFEQSRNVVEDKMEVEDIKKPEITKDSSKQRDLAENSSRKEKKPNVMEILDTDTESIKQDTKVSNDSDFDFSNS